MTYTTTSPAVRRAITTYDNHGLTHLEALVAVLTEHKRGLQERLAAAHRANASMVEAVECQSAEIDRLTAEVAALKAHPAIVLPEVTDEDVDAFRCAYYHDVRTIPWGGLSDDTRERWRLGAHTLRDRLAASLPVDPDARYIEAMAKAMAASYIGEDWESRALDARAALAAYRAHVDKEN